ncbi:PREDICTED: uncharacterized protein LOC104807213 [Tarenaya hassleriana]|uniref:uncharacterized protein LOC104807213 n=1 Tax=Tarenaya hassleriana TaxID=28532 RepID=UPI00053C9929|nr:PREDICTED: uncharacterized protein LOC104807213 [Tarenaya hassleriana]
MEFLLLLLALSSFASSIYGAKPLSYDYSASIECLEKPLQPQYNGGIIKNPEFNEGLLGWSQFGDSRVGFRDLRGNKFAVAGSRNQSYGSVSQKLYLKKGLLYTFSAWLQVSDGMAPVSAIFKTRSGYRHAGAIVAESKCWSMIKGGLTVEKSGPVELYFESKDTTVEIWVDNVSLQPFTQEEWTSHQELSVQKTRKGTVKIKAVDSEGKPVPNATISIQQNNLGFPFGCETESNILGSQAYQDWFTKRFTVTTFANEMKWYSNEVVRGKEDYSTADTMLQFFKQHGIAVRGHNVLWNDPQYQPQWVKSLTGDDLYQAMRQRVNSVVSRYRGQLMGWDVVNEQLPFSFFDSRLGPTAPGEIYNLAHAADSGVTLFMNEYNTLEEPNDKSCSPARYLQRLRDIQSYKDNNGIPMGIGLESHFKSPNIPYVRSALDTLAATGLPIWITELDINSSPDKQPQYLEQILREVHSHPQVKGIVLWAGLGPTGCYHMCLTDGNYKNLPTGDVVDKLIGEWGGFRKQTVGVADRDGFFEASLFHGDYEVKISKPFASQTAATHVFKLSSEVETNSDVSGAFVFRV